MSSNGQYQLVTSSTGGLYLTTNGTSWTNLTNGLPSGVTFSTGSISADGKYILVGVNGGYMYVSRDSGATFANVNPNTPYAYFPFDGNITDSKGNVTLTTTGSVSYVTGIVGTNAINISNTAGGTATNYLSGSITPGNNFSVSLWFNFQSLPATNSTASNIITFGTSSQWVFQIMYLNLSGYTGFYVQYYDGISSTASILGGYTSVNTNTWYNITCTFQVTGRNIVYINNTLVANVASNGISAAITTMRIGYSIGATATAFNGYIDDLKIYGSAIGFTLMVPMNYSYSAVSGTGQYMAVAVASGGLFLSSNYGSTWSQVTSVISTGAWTGLSLSHTGQYMLTNGSVMTSPNMTGLTGSATQNATTTWTVNGVTWTCSASSSYTYNGSSNNSWFAFNNMYSSIAFPNGWSTVNTVPGSITTTILGGIGTVYGEWLQIQSSIPLTIYNYAFEAGNTVGGMPKIYYIVGSNDGINWYPIQYVSAGTNPYTTAFGGKTTFVTVNQSGVNQSDTQTITADVSSTFTTTTYSTTTNSYTYFRIVVNTTFNSANAVEFSEWFINFVGGQSYSTDYGANWTNTLNTNYNQNTIMPNSSLITNSSTSTTTVQWVANNVTWIASASSVYSSYGVSYAFDNTAPGGTWNSGHNYNGSGTYYGSTKTFVVGSSAISGEWLQIRSSIPLIMYSYLFYAGGYWQYPKSFTIVGSNDGINWYKLQTVTIPSTPAGTTNYASSSTYIIVNQSGSQNMPTSGGSAVFTCNNTSYSTNAYTFFRLVTQSIFGNGTATDDVSIGEWYINFTTPYGQTTASFNSIQPLSTIATPNCLTLSANGQYALGANLQSISIVSNYLDGFLKNSATVSSPYNPNIYLASAGTLAYYSFNETSTPAAFSESIYGYNATLNGTVTALGIGKAGTSAYFNGGYLSLNSALYSTYNNLTNGSISCWVYVTDSASLTTSMIFAKQRSGTTTYSGLSIGGYNNGGGVLTAGTSGKVYFAMSNAQANSACSSTTNLALNTWYHIVVTFSSTQVLFYINGALDNTYAVSWSLANDTAASGMYIGSNYTSSQVYIFKGYIDEFSLWNVTLSAATISIIYNNTSNIKVIKAVSSRTGQYMVFVTNSISNNIYYSTNYGSSWTSLTLEANPMVSCAISYDGSYITVVSSTKVYTLNNNTIGNNIAIGINAGQTNQGQYTIAMGTGAGQINQSANSIILNASGSILNSYNSGFYVAPIATTLASTSQSFKLLGYGSDNQIVQSDMTVSTSSQIIYGEWIQLQLANATSITSYTLLPLYFTSYFPISWYLIGSVDGILWNVLDVQTATIGWGSYTLQIASPIYSYFRIIFTKINSTGIVDIGAFVLYNNDIPIFPSTTSTTSTSPYTVSGTNNNILSLNSTVVCTVSWSWNTIINQLGVINHNSNNTTYLSSDYYAIFPFDGTVTDVLGKLSAPTVTGTPVYNTTIQMVGTSCLDSTVNTGGAPSLQLGYSLSLNTATGYSIAFWMNPSVTAGVQMLFQCTASSTSVGIEYTINTDGSTSLGYSGVGFWCSSAAMSSIFSKWTHVTITFSGTTGTIYFNGKQVASGTLNNYSTTYFSMVGCHNGAYSFKGYFDDFRIFNRAITINDITNVINNSLYYSSVGLIAVANGYKNTSSGSLLGFSSLSGTSYEYDGIYNAIQGTSTSVNYNANTYINAITAPIDIIAQGLYLTPSAANSNTIISYFTKVVNTTLAQTGPYWGNDFTFGATAAHGQSRNTYFVGSVLAPNGNVILIPEISVNIGIYNPITNTYTNGVAHGQGDYAYRCGVLLPNGNILLCPDQSTTIGIYNPITNVLTAGPVHGQGGNSLNVPILLPNGNVLFSPYNSPICMYNYITNTFIVGSAHGQGANSYNGLVLLPNGNVVLVPFNALNIGIYNYITNTFTVGPVHNQNTIYAYIGGVLLANGNVVFVPYNASNVGIFNSSTTTFISGAAHGQGSGAYNGGVLLPNGNVLFIPASATRFGIYNPYINTFTLGPSATGYNGGTLLPNGTVICSPIRASSVGVLTTNMTCPRDMCLSPYFNKF